MLRQKLRDSQVKRVAIVPTARYECATHCHQPRTKLFLAISVAGGVCSVGFSASKNEKV
jgi:hypothetical protein